MLSCHFRLMQLRCTWSVFSAWAFPVLAGSALLSELNLLFNSTYVLWAWESAPLLEAKQSPLMIFHSLMLSEKAECAQWQSRDQKKHNPGLAADLMCACAYIFSLCCSDVFFSRMLWLCSSQLVTFCSKQRDCLKLLSCGKAGGVNLRLK